MEIKFKKKILLKRVKASGTIFIESNLYTISRKIDIEAENINSTLQPLDCFIEILAISPDETTIYENTLCWNGMTAEILPKCVDKIVSDAIPIFVTFENKCLGTVFLFPYLNSEYRLRNEKTLTGSVELENNRKLNFKLVVEVEVAEY